MPGTHRKHFTTCLAVIACLALLGGVLTAISPSARASTSTQLSHLRPATNSPAFPYVDSNGQLRDGSGNPIYLRGAMIDSNLAYYKRWPTDVMNLVYTATTFQKMHDVWGMNAVRLDISYWLYEDNPGDGNGGTYQKDLETIIGLANDYGLYVVLDFHNDAQAEGSSPTPPTADGVLHQSEMNWWISLATQTQNASNTMLIFDLINEPKYGSWSAWCEGSSNHDPSCTKSGDIVGLPDAVSQMRTAGVQQPIVVEPGDAAKQGGSQDSGWQNYNTSWISDPDILYSKHDYGEITKAQVQDPTAYQSQWDAEWGPLMNSQGQHTKALYYGEWAIETDRACYQNGSTSEPTWQDADTFDNNFLQYMQARNINWTAYAFGPNELLQGTNNQTAYTNYMPSTFDIGTQWQCGPSTPQGTLGQGTDVKNFLSNNPFPTPLATDTFQRPNQQHWGTASDGHVWGANAGNNSIFNIVSDTGQASDGNGSSYNGTLGGNAPNEEVVFTGSLSNVTINGYSNRLGAVLRYTDSSDFYYAYIDSNNSDGSQYLVVSKKITGTQGETVLQKFAIAVTNNTSYTLKFAIVNTTLLAKAWVTGNQEPDWEINYTDTTSPLESPGICGVRMLLQNSQPTATYTSFAATYI